MFITPSRTQHYSGFLTWREKFSTTTYWALETCCSRWKRFLRDKKICPPSANIRRCKFVCGLLSSLLSLSEETDNHAGLLHLSASSPSIGNHGNQHHGTPEEGIASVNGEGWEIVSVFPASVPLASSRSVCTKREN